MSGEHKRRAIEASMPEISEAHRDLILKMDEDPEESFRDLERKGYKIPGRPVRIPEEDYK